MAKLDNLKKIKEIGKGGVIESIEGLPHQLRQVLEEAHLIKIPHNYKNIDKVVVNGMGASNLGAGIFKAVFSDQVKVPINIVPGYEVPAYVDKNTLYILSSYSGGTEEPLMAYKEAKRRGAKLAGITANLHDKLEKLMIKENIPGYIFKPENNHSNIPRLGLGYAIFGTATILAKAGLAEIRPRDIEKIISTLEIWDRELRPASKTENNPAKRLAEKLHGKLTVCVGAEFLTGNLRVLRNQFCENAKNFAAYLTLPELNHYAMEGLAHPKSNKKDLAFFFIDSDFYSKRVRLRSGLTKEVVKKNGLRIVDYRLKGRSKLEQAFELLQLGTWLTFYLAVLNDNNSGGNPWVDWFKKELASQK